MSLSWLEKVPIISINPDFASKEDVARLAADLMEARHELLRLSDVVGDIDREIIDSILKGDSP